jgi:predicted PurR-regulated permease PerM
MLQSDPSLEVAPLKETPPAVTGRRDLPGYALPALLALASLYTLYFARELLLPIVTAYFLKLVFAPAVRRLKLWRIPEPLGAAFVLGLALGTGAVAAYSLSGPANEWIARAPAILREARNELRALTRPVENVSRAAEQVEQMTDGNAPPRAETVTVRGPSLTSLLFESTTYFVSTAVATLTLLYLFLAAGDLFLIKIITILPRLEDKVTAVELSRELERSISRYLATVTLINIALGIAVGLLMHWLGMPNPYLWGMVAGLFNFVPYVGALSTFAILTLAAYVTFDDAAKAMLVGGLFFAVNGIEGYLVTPSVLGQRMSMNPVAIFISLIVFGWAWGVYGLLLAVPILAGTKLLCERVQSLQPLGELIGG